MPRFSASLGFLWPEMPLPDRVYAAAEAGFEAVECHWPYEEDPVAVRRALDDTGLPMLSLNTPRGDPEAGEYGFGAVPGREREAMRGVDLAVEYAVATGTRNIHVMSGIAGDHPAARDALLATLAHAAERTEPHGIGVLIEPINRLDWPGYYLHRVAQARAVIDALGDPAIGLMFDCYHVQKTEGNLMERLVDNLDAVTHVQIAAVPDRGEPDRGEINYDWLFGQIDAVGYQGFVGAEYVPRSTTRDGLGWYARWRRDDARMPEGRQ